MSGKDTLVKKLGSEEKYVQYMRSLAAKKRRSSRGGFSDIEFASKMGKIGGRIGKRGPSKNV